jgi:Cu/Ag efflux protein CusF
MGSMRRGWWWAVCVVSLSVFAGCASAYTPPPLTTQHPAHPEAVAAPTLPPSQTLAYDPAARPTPPPAMAMAHQSGHSTHMSAHGRQHMVVAEGKVIAVVPGSQQIVVDHKEIPGVMGAMTMGYRAEPPSLLEEVKPGDTIRFTMDTQQQTIIKLEKLTE